MVKKADVIEQQTELFGGDPCSQLRNLSAYSMPCAAVAICCASSVSGETFTP